MGRQVIKEKEVKRFVLEQKKGKETSAQGKAVQG